MYGVGKHSGACLWPSYAANDMLRPRFQSVPPSRFIPPHWPTGPPDSYARSFGALSLSFALSHELRLNRIRSDFLEKDS